MNDAAQAIPADSQLKRDMPLVPADSIAGRALVVVIAIMTFLACLTAGGAILVGEASQAWRGDVSRDVTIQIKPRAGEDVDAVVAAAAEIASRAPGVADAVAYSKAQSEAILAPWLGDGVDLGQLPIPRLIIVHMQAGHRDDLEPLRAALAAGGAGGEPRRSPPVAVAARRDGGRDRRLRRRPVRADDRRDGNGGRLRHPRRDGGRARDRRGAAFRRRRRFLHRRPVPGTFLPPRPRRGGDRRRRGGGVLRRGGARFASSPGAPRPARRSPRCSAPSGSACRAMPRSPSSPARSPS